MRVAREKFDGAQLGIEGECDAEVIFTYDPRGPRVSPAVEVQGWIDPPPFGTPYDAPTQVGIQALGMAVPSLPVTVERLVSLGCTAIGSLSDLLGSGAAHLRDPFGAGLDILEEPGLASASRFAHLRVTCSDLSASMEWYQQIGFQVVEERRTVTALSGRFEACQLRLPDEPLRMILMQGIEPASEGHAYDRANHRGLYRIAIGVDDTRAAFETLGQAGFNFTDGPRLTELSGTPVPDMWIAFTRDPDGIPVEFVQRPRSAFR
jgi:catechol 2,3-dioxygenase-like lactoylglutathione lyase family enzyme